MLVLISLVSFFRRHEIKTLFYEAFTIERLYNFLERNTFATEFENSAI